MHVYIQPLAMIKTENEGMRVSGWCTAVENRITLIYVRSAPSRSSITHSWPTKPDIYVHCGYIRLFHSQIYGLQAVLFTVWVYEYHCFVAFRVSTCVVSVKWPLQALIPICVWLMVIPWCITLSGCWGRLLTVCLKIIFRHLNEYNFTNMPDINGGLFK